MAGLLAGLFAVIKNIEGAAQAANFAILLAFCTVNASAVKLFGKEGLSIGFRRIFTDIILPGSGAAVCLWLASETGWLAALLGAGLLLAGELAYRVMGSMSRNGKAG